MTDKRLIRFILNWLATTLEGRLHLIMVILPSAFTVMYLYMVAPDRYLSSAELSIYDSTSVAPSEDVLW